MALSVSENASGAVMARFGTPKYALFPAQPLTTKINANKKKIITSRLVISGLLSGHAIEKPEFIENSLVIFRSTGSAVQSLPHP
jgi:hypothetical protein